MKFLSLDKLGLTVSVLLLLSLFALPFISLQPNRIIPGEGLFLNDILGPVHLIVLLLLAGCIFVSASNANTLKTQLMVSSAAAFYLIYLAGITATESLAEALPFARASLDSSFWLSSFFLALLITDALIKLQVTPLKRLSLITCYLAAIATLLISGTWDDLSIIKEYQNQHTFWQQAIRHLQLSFGSIIPALIIGIPLGIKCHRSKTVRAIIFPILNLLQTIPSLAMFGILMIPLSYLASTYPVLSEYGIRGIGAAPAVIALFFYSLLPIVSNTAVGFDKLDSKTLDAAYGMGMNARQILFKIEFPLALPIILSGFRVVVTMNIGLVAVAGLIGGGGFGTYIFQGLGQTATDLVILGAIPTLFLSFLSAILIDTVIAILKDDRP
ncbi:ABC transporter permease [Photobacterium makurazakiensis]|uniref:ABC transporter permease n=1 Tax=Photobacterium makurazakiensis TaxID=2910234 RepID=UPI003D119D0B